MALLQSMLYIYTRISNWLHFKLGRNNPVGNSVQDSTSSDGHTSQDEKGRRDIEGQQRALTGNRVVLGLGRAKTDDEDILAENRQLKARIAQLEGLPAELAELRRNLEQESLALKESREQHDRAAEDAHQLRTRFMHLDSEAKRSAAKIADVQRAQAQAEAERHSAQALLDMRTAELREAQTFLTKVDDITEDEVIHIVELLNAQIVKTAAVIAGTPQLHFHSGSQDATAVEKAYRRIEHYGWLGPSLLGALRSYDHARNPTLVCIAIQAGLIMYARWLALSWDFGAIDPRALLESIYLRVREREPQSVAGRWRALCRTHIKGLIDTGETQTQRLFKTLTGVVADILFICSAAGTLENISEMVATGFETQFHEILNLALQFQWIAGERVVSRDLVVFAEDPEGSFNAARMIDEKSSGLRRAPGSSLRFGSVLCTTQLGLMSERQVTGRQDDPGTVQATVLLKPQVVLKSALAEFQSK